MHKTKGNSGTSRSLNRRLILNLLRRNGEMSRAEISESIGLSPAAVTFVVGELLHEGAVLEGAAGKSGGGRRPIPIKINYKGRLAVGFKLAANNTLEAVLTDLATEVIKSITSTLPDTVPETVVRIAAETIETLIPDAAVRKADLIGVGLALPGVFDVETGVCLEIPRLGWKNVPIAAMLARVVDVPVWVDNDVNAFALAQYLFGHGRHHSTMMALAIGAGIGAAFLTRGTLHRGSSGAAGEIGHSRHIKNGRSCDCGRKGCMQAYFSERALRKDWQDIAKDTALPQDLAEAARLEVPQALELLRGAGAGIGGILAAAVNLVDPDVIVIGGEAVQLGPVFFDAIRQAIAEQCFAAPPEVIVDWQDNAWARGAAALAVQRFFNFESTEGEIAGDE